MTGAEQLVLTLPNDLSYLPIALATVREAARTFGFEEEQIKCIELGLEEAVSNVIEHAFETSEQSTFDIVCARIPLGLRLILREKGLPFDPNRMPSYDPEKAPADGSSMGLGVFLMKGMMDEVSFHNLGVDGKETRLVKYLRGKNVEQYFAPGTLSTEAPPPGLGRAVPSAGKIDYDVRAMRPDEAIEVSKCAYKSHGYTFFDEHIYFPERLVELNKSGDLISAVAVTRDNTFIGHAALHYPRSGAAIAELTFVFVNVEYRGQGCMNRLVEHLFTVPKPFPLTGLYAYAVTNHPFTQKANVKFGLCDCGLLLATSPATWLFKGIPGENSQRISVLLSFKYLEPPQGRALYPPERHRGMVGKLYAGLGAPHRMESVDRGTFKLPEQSLVETEVFATENCAEICVARSGAQLAREIKGLLRELCLKQIAAINLFLNLEDPATALVTPDLEALGFFFAGILPHSRVGEALIFQYLNNVPLDYARIVAHSETARELVAYVKANDPNAG